MRKGPGAIPGPLFSGVRKQVSGNRGQETGVRYQGRKSEIFLVLDP
jgi:hypothetical protein